MVVRGVTMTSAFRIKCSNNNGFMYHLINFNYKYYLCHRRWTPHYA